MGTDQPCASIVTFPGRQGATLSLIDRSRLVPAEPRPQAALLGWLPPLGARAQSPDGCELLFVVQFGALKSIIR